MLHRESDNPTPYAVHCRYKCNDGRLVFMTKTFYDYQMSNPDYLWQCPRCGADADWDDANYQLYFKEGVQT